MHRALIVTQNSDHIDPTYALNHRLDRASFLTWPRPLFIHRKRPKQGPTSLSRYNIPKKPKKVPQKVARSRDLLFAMPSIFDRQSKYQTVSYDQVFLKTWLRANKPPTLTYDSSRVPLLWVTLPRRPQASLKLLRRVSLLLLLARQNPE
jgi:hypothetical protein